jgi:hypothetical protein
MLSGESIEERSGLPSKESAVTRQNYYSRKSALRGGFA